MIMFFNVKKVTMSYLRLIYFILWVFVKMSLCRSQDLYLLMSGEIAHSVSTEFKHFIRLDGSVLFWQFFNSVSFLQLWFVRSAYH